MNTEKEEYKLTEPQKLKIEDEHSVWVKAELSAKEYSNIRIKASN